jgi:hypothetical protein
MSDGDQKRKEAVEAARAALSEATGEINESEVETPAETPDEASAIETPSEAPPERSSSEVERLQAEVQRLNSILDDENNATYKSRWQVLQGMWKKQEDEIANLKAEITRLSTEKPKPVVPEQDDDDAEYQSDLEEWGESEAKKKQKMRNKQRQLEEQSAKTLKELENLRAKTERVEGAAAQFEQTQAMTASERFFGKLSDEVPNWQELNGDGRTTINPKFASFLASTPPGGDEDYNTILQRNHQKGNINKVIEIFNVFNKAAGLTTEKAKPSSKAEKFLEPGKTGQGTTEPSDKQDVVTRSEITKFRQSSQFKDFKGTQAEREALRAKYRKAELEGTVIENK